MRMQSASGLGGHLRQRRNGHVRTPHRQSPLPGATAALLMSDGGDRFATVTRGIIIAAAAVAGMAMVVVALWAWQGSVDMVADWDVLRPGAVVWAIRCGAIASAALAQVVILGGVAGQIFPRRSADQAAIIAAAGICLSAIVGGTILAAVGR